MISHLRAAGFEMSDLDPNMKTPKSVGEDEGGYLKDQKFPKNPIPKVQKSYPTPEDPPPGRGWLPTDWTE